MRIERTQLNEQINEKYFPEPKRQNCTNIKISQNLHFEHKIIGYKTEPETVQCSEKGEVNGSDEVNMFSVSSSEKKNEKISILINRLIFAFFVMEKLVNIWLLQMRRFFTNLIIFSTMVTLFHLYVFCVRTCAASEIANYVVYYYILQCKMRNNNRLTSN